MVSAPGSAVTFAPEPEMPDDGLAGFAPESVWALRHGRAFDVTATAPRRDARDYAWQIVLETRAGPSEAALASAPDGTPDDSPDGGEVPLVGPGSDAGLPREAIPVVPLRAGRTAAGACSAEAYLAPLADGGAGAPNPSPAPMSGSGDPVHVTRARFRAPLRADAIAAGPLSRPGYARQNLAQQGRAAIVGIIDDAINPLHDRFRAADGGTRVDFFWAQDARATASGTVPFGRAWDRPALEAELARPAATTCDRLHRLGLLDAARGGPAPLAARVGHGTHVADLAAGFDPAEAPRGARIVAVALPALVTLETSGGTLAPFLIAALDHILDRAALISETEGAALPVLVNFSYALSGGPRNGLHLIETAIDALVAAHEARMARAFPSAPVPPVQVLLPAGNAHLDRLHAATDPAPAPGRATLEVDWRVNPGDATQNLAEIWLPRDASEVAIALAPPGGAPQSLEALEAGRAVLLHDGPAGPVIGRVAGETQAGETQASGAQAGAVQNGRAGDAPGTRLRRVLIALAPTQVAPGAGAWPAPPGRWRIAVSAGLARGETIRVAVLRDEAPAGQRRPGRASWLEHPAYRRFDARGDLETRDQPGCPVRRAGSLSGIATGSRTTVVGGWEGTAQGFPDGCRPARYAGASADGLREVDLAARADRSRARAGVPAAGIASGSVVAMSGTSVAAPQALRALLLARLGRDAPDAAETGRADPQLGAALLPPLPRRAAAD